MLLRAPRCDSLPDPYISLILLTRNAMIYYCRHNCGKQRSQRPIFPIHYLFLGLESGGLGVSPPK